MVTSVESAPSRLHAELVMELCQRYAEPARHYHTLEHVSELLAWLEILRAHAAQPASIAWAIWFHDAVYDPTRQDNEARSAELALARLPALGLPPQDCETVAALVTATAHHHAHAAQGDLALFLDLDLSILGAPAARYDAYTRQVRSEYAFVAEEAFRAGRGKLLAAWLTKPRLYFTDVCSALFEHQARENLSRELALLTAT